MTLEHACIVPHGGELIPSLASHRAMNLFHDTQEDIRRIASDIVEARPDTIVIASPRNLRLWNNIGIVMAENSTGTLQGSRSRSVHLRARCDVAFAPKLIQAALRSHLPVAGANYGTSEGFTSDMPMDWGNPVPLWFVFRENRVKAKTVIVTPSREIPLGQNLPLGEWL